MIMHDLSWIRSSRLSFDELEQYINLDLPVCLMCGRVLKTIQAHLKAAHQIDMAEYREIYGIPVSYTIAARDTRERLSALAKDNYVNGRISLVPGTRCKKNEIQRPIRPEIRDIRGKENLSKIGALGLRERIRKLHRGGIAFGGHKWKPGVPLPKTTEHRERIREALLLRWALIRETPPERLDAALLELSRRLKRETRRRAAHKWEAKRLARFLPRTACLPNPSDQRAGASPAPLYQVVGQTADDRLSYVDAELRKWYGDDPAPIEHIARSVKKHCDDLSARLDAVRDELEDWKDAARAAASGGHPDEVHCTCVPLLQKSLKDCKREREELLAIADRTREQLAARVRYLEREMGDLDQEMEWLQGDIEGQAQRDRIVLYHHNCMSGTDCDACRVMGRIRDIRARLCLPNTSDQLRDTAPTVDMRCERPACDQGGAT